VNASKSGSDRSYKRSWKNLLINKRYQLRFTLFMVGLSSLLMGGLGIWVMRVANETTEVSMASVRGEACPKVPVIGDAAPTGEEEEAAPAPAMKLDDSPGNHPGDARPPAKAPSEPAAASAPLAPAPTGNGKPPDGKPDEKPEGKPDSKSVPSPKPAPGAATDSEPRRATVQLGESSMTLTPVLPPDLADRFVAHWTCEIRQAATFDRLERGRLRILWAMIVTGVFLVLGLAVYGIKMTHRVAGPLFKVTLYLSRMREGRYDKVYNLRKGDQLVEFYDHFKLAHGGVVAMQQADIDRISSVIAAAEASGVGEHAAIVELREMLARKEKSIE
jgi:hypothetical protein